MSAADPPAGIEVAEILVSPAVPERWIAHAPALRWIHSPSAGVDQVLSPSVARRGIVVTSARGSYDQAVAEHAVALLLALARRLPSIAARAEGRDWLRLGEIPGIVELGGRTLTVVGMGSIGGRVAEIASALGMRVLGVRRTPAPHAAAERVVGEGGLLEALGESHALVMVLPDTPESRHVVGRRELLALQDGAFVVNVGRGSTLDAGALVDLLESGHLAGAALDVTDPEPPAPGSRLWSAPNLVLTGHTAGSSEHHPHRQLRQFGDYLAAYLEGRPLPQVDPGRGY